VIILTNSGTDKLQVVTSAAATVDAIASFVDTTGVAGSNVTPGTQKTAITTATTTDVLATPGASTFRGLKALFLRNKHASLSTDVTVVFDANGTDYELFKTTLAPGEVLEYTDELGFYKAENTALMSLTLRKTADQVFATAASFADITDFTCPMLSGHKYSFEAFIFHITNATTTGAQFGVNIGAAPTLLIAGGAHQITSSLTAAGFGASSAVTARDTAIVAETTGPGAVVATANIAGTIIPSADGTFALRATSEVTVANGLTVKAGSLLRIREYDN
jgi:hypothetical protein